MTSKLSLLVCIHFCLFRLTDTNFPLDMLTIKCDYKIADNGWRMYLNGDIIDGPKDSDTIIAWQQIRTATTQFEGDQPLVIGIRVVDTGIIAGLFAAVYLDGELYAATSVPNLQGSFSMTMDKPSVGWNTDSNFDESNWYFDSGKNICKDIEYMWASMLQRLDRRTPGVQARAIWHPHCKDAGTPKNPKTAYFRLVLKPKKMIPQNFQSPSLYNTPYTVRPNLILPPPSYNQQNGFHSDNQQLPSQEVFTEQGASSSNNQYGLPSDNQPFPSQDIFKEQGLDKFSQKQHPISNGKPSNNLEPAEDPFVYDEFPM